MQHRQTNQAEDSGDSRRQPRTGWYIGFILLAMFTISPVSGCGGGGSSVVQPPAGGGPVAGTANISGQLVEGNGGRITSAAGSALPGVLVQLISALDGRLAGSRSTDAQGRYEFKAVPSGQSYLLKVEFSANRDLNGDGLNDRVELTLPLSPASQSTLSLLSRVGVADSNGDGQDDAIRFENEIGDDKGGLRQRDSEHRISERRTVIDDNGNGSFDDDLAFDDSDCDGLPDDNGSGGNSSSPGEREVYGAIEAIGAASISVKGLSFGLTSATRFMGRDNEPLTAASFPVGVFVEVEGFNSSSGLIAYKVKLEDGAGAGGGSIPDDELEKQGSIEALSSTTISVGGVDFRLTENTQWRIGDNRNADPARFTVGMLVEVTGDSDGQGGWLARRVKLED